MQFARRFWKATETRASKNEVGRFMGPPTTPLELSLRYLHYGGGNLGKGRGVV